MRMNNFATGMVAGIIIGSAVIMMGDSKTKAAVNIKRNVGKTLKTIGQVVDSF